MHCILTSSGSDQSRSQTRPRSGTSIGLSISRIWTQDEMRGQARDSGLSGFCLVQVLEVWWQSTVHTEDGILNNSSCKENELIHIKSIEYDYGILHSHCMNWDKLQQTCMATNFLTSWLTIWITNQLQSTSNSLLGWTHSATAVSKATTQYAHSQQSVVFCLSTVSRQSNQSTMP